MALSDVTVPAVERAIAEYDRLGEEEFLRRYGYREARVYSMRHSGRLYPSKAIVGVAHQYLGPGSPALRPNDFSGGEATVARLLRRLGFEMLVDGQYEPDAEWHLEEGETVRRVELHDRYGGSRQGGIAPSMKSSNVFVFTSAASGNQHGYFDRWESDDKLIYCGEGQSGDQEMSRGNVALLHHATANRALRLFEGARGVVRYLGEFAVDVDDPWSWGVAPSTAGGPQRRVIMFRLHRVGASPRTRRSRRRAAASSGTVLTGAYREADEGVSTQARADFQVDPDQVDRALRAHAHLQNLVAGWAVEHGFTPASPEPGEPAFDVGWWDGLTFVVGEVKSLQSGLPSVSQLRLGLGQVLDYQDDLRQRGITVRAILAVETEPQARWPRVCLENGVVLVWPGVFDRLLSPSH
ncbi:MAG: hypothetical protein O3B31_07375 [Chloroflexi bacterium]|nr:hypothetical protein [Chloroflexota bacterium]